MKIDDKKKLLTFEHLVEKTESDEIINSVTSKQVKITIDAFKAENAKGDLKQSSIMDAYELGKKSARDFINALDL